LNLTGAVAQYGRASGVIRELAGQITQEFAERLKRQIAAEVPTTETPGPGPALKLQEEPAPERAQEGVGLGRLIARAILAFLKGLLARKPE
jgi:hypothetical protein